MPSPLKARCIRERRDAISKAELGIISGRSKCFHCLCVFKIQNEFVLWTCMLLHFTN